MAGKRPAREIMEERLADCETHLVRLRVSDRVEIAMSKKYSVSRRTVRRWVHAIHERWEEESRDDTASKRAMRRSDYRAVLNETLAMALNHVETHTTTMPDGTVIEKKVPKPDLRTALNSVFQLRKLDGVDAPEAPQRIDATLRHTASPEDRDELTAFLLGRKANPPGA